MKTAPVLRRSLLAVMCALATTSVFAADLPSGDWPKWRGPNGDNISQDAKFSANWPAEAKKVWSAAVGIGYSSPVAVDGRVYLFSTIDGKDTLLAFDASTGKQIYKEAYDSGWTQSYPGTRATPLIEDKTIFTFGGAGDLTARELATGKQLWRINPLKKVSANPNQWGAASNMLSLGDLLYVQTGQGGPIAVAVSKKTGEIVHKASFKADAGYAAPIAIEVDKKKQIVIFGGEKVYGLTEDLSQQLWSEPWHTAYAVNASTPIFRDGKLFLTSAYNQGSLMLEITASGSKRLWESKDLQSRFQGAILDGDHLFASSEGKILCLQWPENKVLWKDKDSANQIGLGALVRHGENLVALSDHGKLLLLQTTGKEPPKRLAVYKDLVDGNEVWATPLLYDGRIYVKGKDELVCIDVSGK